MRKFALGDLHGSYLALKQVLEKSNFDYENDKLIFLGDIVDGWSQSVECIRELMKIKNLVFIRGNHDLWFLEFFNNNIKLGMLHEYESWLKHGGRATLDSFNKIPKEEQGELYDFIKNKSVIYHEEDNRLYVHGGFSQNYDIKLHSEEELCWDRNLIKQAYKNRNILSKIDEKYDEIFIGHTPLQFMNQENDFNPLFPQKWTNVCAMDTGCAFNGCLSLMDIEKKVVYLSELSMKLYPDEKGRNDKSFNDYETK